MSKKEGKGELVKVTPGTITQTVQHMPDGNIVVMAENEVQMRQSQEALVAWFDKKVESRKQEAAELEENLAIAKKNKWKTSTLKRHASLARKRVTFTEKIRSALKAGYRIVPNFPVDFISVRTDKKFPSRKTCFSRWSVGEVDCPCLPVGEGENVSSEASTKSRRVERKNVAGKTYEADLWQADELEEIDFPVALAKPQVMDAAGEALKKKIFDKVGVLPAKRRNADPVVIGLILGPKNGYSQLEVSFLISWHLDTSDF